MSNVHNPSHYSEGCSIDCIESMRIAFGDDDTIKFCLLNSYKYLWRYKMKNGKEDLDKADEYIKMAYKIVDDLDYNKSIQTLELFLELHPLDRLIELKKLEYNDNTPVFYDD